MKKILMKAAFICCLMFSGLHSYASVTSNQALSTLDDTNDEVFQSAEQPAEFPGGLAALSKWLSQSIRYPEAAVANDIQGRVIVSFIIEKDGSISDIKIQKGVDSDLDQEAIRVVSRMPKWMPAKNNGEPVRSYYTLPVTFKLQS